MIKFKKLFFDNYFFNLNFSITVAHIELKFCVSILRTYPEGTVSQIPHLGLSSHFMPKIWKLFATFPNLIF